MDSLGPAKQVALPGVPHVGEVIAEKYLVEGLLGAGGMGVVLAARHLKLGQAVAIKILTVGEDQQQDAVARFLREGRAAAALASDHVVRIYDVGQLENGGPFMVMERLRGEDLALRLQERGALPVDEAVEYTAQATMAIAEAHEAGIIHRDLKPGNLFLTRRSDGTACVKVLDFGISKQLSMFDSKTLRADLTSTRQVMGSPAYMSPEQVRDARNVDHRTDIWALGTTLYELLTGHVAFNADTLPAICAAIAADPPTPISEYRSDVPASVQAIVCCCLQKAPERRFATARALLSALRAYQGRPDVMVSLRELPLATSLSCDGQHRQSDSDSKRDVKESGSRSRNDVPSSDNGESTLLSSQSGAHAATAGAIAAPLPAAAAGPFPTVPSAEAGPATVASNRSRYKRPGYFVVLGLGLCGAVAAAVLFKSQPTDRGEFSLRIESEPSGATVFEGPRWLGETPLVLPIDRESVQQKPRLFALRKAGYVDAQLAQADSAADRQVQVTLSQATAGSIGVEPVATLSAASASAAAAPPRRPTMKSPVSAAHLRGGPAPATAATGAPQASDIRQKR